MTSTLLIGLAVVAVGAGFGGLLMFGQRANPLAGTAPTPGTIPAAPRGAGGDLSASSGSAAGRTTGAVRIVTPDQDVHIRWYERLRSGLILLLITVGIGMALGAVIGAAALAISIVMG